MVLERVAVEGTTVCEVGRITIGGGGLEVAGDADVVTMLLERVAAEEPVLTFDKLGVKDTILV